MRAVVLAAGFGTRLYPLTRDRAKPLLEVGGRPVVEHLVEKLAAARRVDDVVLVTNGRFEEDFRSWAEGLDPPARRRLGIVSNGVTDPDELRGAVADLRSGLEPVSRPDDGYLVFSADNLFEFSVDGLAEACLDRSRAEAAVAVEAPVSLEEAVGKGVACVDDDGWVVRVEEKPAEPTCRRPVASAYAFRPELPEWIDRYLAEGGAPDPPGRFIAWLAAGPRPVAAFPISGYRFDVGTPERLREARAFFGG